LPARRSGQATGSTNRRQRGQQKREVQRGLGPKAVESERNIHSSHGTFSVLANQPPHHRVVFGQMPVGRGRHANPLFHNPTLLYNSRGNEAQICFRFPFSVFENPPFPIPAKSKTLPQLPA